MTVVERPIIFSSSMVLAILAGTKTQTRRAIKAQPNPMIVAGASLVDRIWCWLNGHDGSIAAKILGHGRCPYGQPGDRLWVREAFMHEPADYCWEASVSIPSRPAVTIYRADVKGDSRGAGWKPSIHMPRHLSRIDLEITGIRVERLSDISRDDAEAEGIGLQRVSENDFRWIDYTDKDRSHTFGDPRHSFWSLWKQINGTESHDSNPWVWVVAFRRVGHA